MAVATSLIALDFLSVKPGDYVIVEENFSELIKGKTNWWVAYVLHAVGGARSSSLNTLFQVVNVDTGHIKHINADLVIKILKKS